MKKRKIIYGVSIVLILLLIVGFIFYYINFMNVVVCTREGAFLTEQNQKDIITINFKLDGTVKKAIFEQKVEFEKEEYAEKYYNNLTAQKGSTKKLDGKNVIISYNDELGDNEKKYRRKNVIKKYEELDYECK